MAETWAFNPLYTNTGSAGTPAGTLLPSVTIAASTTHAEGSLPGGTSYGNTQIQIANKAASWAFVNFGIAGSVTAATVANSYPVAPGAVVVVTVAQEVTGVSVILDVGATAANVIFTRGNGL